MSRLETSPPGGSLHSPSQRWVESRELETPSSGKLLIVLKVPPDEGMVVILETSPAGKFVDILAKFSLCLRLKQLIDSHMVRNPLDGKLADI